MDEDHNREGNAGLGFRFKTDLDGIWGSYAFYDRKLSDKTGKLHTQATVGTEWLADNWEVRLNGYFPMTGKKEIAAGNPAGLVVSDPFLMGSGIYVEQTAAQLLEERPSRGVDTEVGFSLPFLEDLWLYAGGFSFKADGGSSLTGYRGRMSYDLTDNVAFTAEGQWDDERGRQAWLGLRLSFALGETEKLDETYRKRMTSLPVRDVDIVTSVSVVGAPTSYWQVLNADTLAAQRILYVDNTASPGGDGSKEHPFATLAEVQAVLQEYDIVYISHGDGTSTGLDTGFLVNRANVEVIGEGTPFVYSGSRFTTDLGNFNGSVLQVAGQAPVLTNASGDAVTVTGDNAFLAGFDIENASGKGIYIENASAVVDSINIHNIGDVGVYVFSDTFGEEARSFTASNIVSEGHLGGIVVFMDVSGDPGAGYSSITMSDITLSDNRYASLPGSHGNGIAVMAQSWGDPVQIDSINLSNINTSDNPYNGITLSGYQSSITSITLSDIVAENNGWYGVGISAAYDATDSVDIQRLTASGNYNGLNLWVEQTTLSNVTISDSVISNNTGEGIYTYVFSNSVLDNVDISSSQITNNGGDGVYLAPSGTGATVNDVNIDGTSISNNAGSGLYMLANTSGSTISNVSLVDSTFSANTDSGVWMSASSGGSLSNISAEASVFTGNSEYGLYINDDTTGTFAVDFGGGVTASTGQNEIYGNTLVDVWLDNDGAQLKAQGNWWGNAAGLLTARRTLNSGTIDASGFLAAAP